MSAFDDAIALEPQPDGTWLGHTSPAYGNMVGPFGGITAAQALNAVLQHPQRLGEPISLTINFCSALADGPFTVVTRAVRTNRSTQHWFVELQQQGETNTTATVVTALRRDVWANDEHAMPGVPAPDTIEPLGPQGRVAWLDRYEMRVIDGHLPQPWDGREHPDSVTRLWVRDTPPRPLDHASLTALSDVFFPRRWRRHATPTPAGTVSMTVYYHADSVRLAATADGLLLGQAQAQAFRGGFFDQTAQLWNRHGDLLATTHQVVYYKA
ncbi:acyl-CoA thioesterase II [Rhizobacter sp. Root1221]|uniref:acyl-CoA thioesterase n=1 Tax=Rhizobacter sp. Root1221 TaxID=1736433 RepID=UPI0006F44382|nr:thioesterase family protein [Rhizobacter sp. Root1221]KQW00068.1 acyl-CoA thioesterase [Rhizobacter sp. Root1221]